MEVLTLLGSPKAHLADRHPTPIEVRPHVCAALAADPTGEALLDIGQSGIIGPSIAADRDGAATCDRLLPAWLATDFA